MMKAVVCERYGGPEVLSVREVEKPRAGEDGIVVRVIAALVVATDPIFRKGEPFIARFFTGLRRPKHPIPGDALAGVVEEVGPGAAAFRPGDRVVCAANLEMGAHAEYIRLLRDSAIVGMPGGLEFGEAAAVCDGALGAIHFLRDCCGVQKGQKVLVIGASGSVGCAAVQLAKYLGAAEVTGVCSGANIGLVESLGADRVIDYTKEDFTNAGETYDVIFDAVAKSSFKRCKASLTPRGVYLATVPTVGYMLGAILRKGSHGKRTILGAPGLRAGTAKARDLEFLLKLASEGNLKTPIDRRYPLGAIREAHAYVETGHKRGNVVLDIAESL